jgi:phosphoglycerol transferase MdoB-like AlkP superfamily enzyme
VLSALTARLGIDRPLAAALRVLVLSLAAFSLALKLHRVALYPGTIRWYARPLLLLPDVAFALGFALLCALLCALATRARVPKLGLIVTQILAIVTAALLVLAHGYYLASGQVLDYPMFAFSFMRASETFSVVQSEASLPLTAALCLVPSWLTIAPWRVLRRTPSSPPGTPTTARFSASVTVCAVACVLAFAGTYPPRLKGAERTFTRDSITFLALGAYDALVPRERYHGKPTRLRKLGATTLKATSEAKPKNLVVIILESTRADATTPYAPGLGTTPFLKRLASESVLVERAYAVVPHTSKALVAIFCGFEPNMTVSVIESLKSALPGTCLPALLAARGYETVYFQAPTAKFENRATLVKNLGFKRFRAGDDAPTKGLQRINYFGYEDAIMLEPSRRFVKGVGDKPFFAAYLTNASHHPYDVPRSHKRQTFTKDRDKNKYLNAVRYVDGVVSRIVQQYKEGGLYDDTVFVVLGDHGEAFDEHGVKVHDDVMFEEGLRIPLLMRLPAAKAHACGDL